MRCYNEKKILSKGNLKNKFKNVIFIGNGAIENGCKLLKRWVCDLSKVTSEKKLIEKDKIRIEEFFANETMKFKVYRSSEHKDLHELVNRKQKLADLYIKSSKNKEICPRDPPRCINKIIKNDNTLIICSNWDNIFFNCNSLKNVIQIHGICDHPHSMIYPFEYVMDYCSGEFPSKKILNAPDLRCYIEELGQLHNDAINAIENCKNLFIWGLALNSYDAEIMSLIMSCKGQESNKKLYVINIDKNAAFRASFISKIYKFTFYDPKYKVEEEIDLTHSW